MPVTYEVRPDHKALYNNKTLKEWLSTVVDDLVGALDPVRIYLFGSLAHNGDGPDSDLDILVVFEQLRDDEISPFLVDARKAITAPVPKDVLVTDLARFEFNQQRWWHIHHQIARTGVLVYEREPRIPKELYMNPPAPNIAKDCEWLLERARQDLADADLLVHHGSKHSTCFNAQQAAELALKALLTIEPIEAPRTHELVELLESLPSRYAELFDKAGLASLTPWALRGRVVNLEDVPDIANRSTEVLVDVARDTVSTVEGLVDELCRRRGRSSDGD